jgi:hypothetical protein
MSETKYINIKWVCKKPGKYIHEWDQFPYFAQSGIRWRGQEILVRISEEGIDCGRKRTFAIVYKGRIYIKGIAKWKWSGGGFGHFPENISDGYFRLTFFCNGPNLSFKEELINAENAPDRKESALVEFFKVPNNTRFSNPEPEREPWIRKETNEIELCNFRDANTASDVVALFDKDRLVLNTWRLGAGEDEYYYIVAGEELRKLYAEFNLQEHQRAELLVGLHNAFSGKDCIEKFSKYLNYKKIQFNQQFCL